VLTEHCKKRKTDLNFENNQFVYSALLADFNISSD